MLGPNDVHDWDYGPRDEVSLLLRRHSVIVSISTGADPGGLGAPEAVRACAIAFARQEHLPWDDLLSLAHGLGLHD